MNGKPEQPAPGLAMSRGLQARVLAAASSTLGIHTPDQCVLCYLIELARVSNEQRLLSRTRAARACNQTPEQIHTSLNSLRHAGLVHIDCHAPGEDGYRFSIDVAALQQCVDVAQAKRWALLNPKGPFGRGRVL